MRDFPTTSPQCREVGHAGSVRSRQGGIHREADLEIVGALGPRRTCCLVQRQQEQRRLGRPALVAEGAVVIVHAAGHRSKPAVGVGTGLELQ